MSWTSTQQREVPWGRSNKWTVNERRGRKEEAGQMEAQQSYKDLQWTNLNTKEACWGQKVFRCMFAVNPFRTLFILKESMICCFSTMPLHPPHYEVLINWARARRDGLTSLLIALALSSPLAHWGRQPYSSGPLAALPDLWFTLH